MRRAIRFGTLVSIVIVLPAPAMPHAFAERYDLPLPLGFYLAGAGMAVAVSFLGSFLLMRPGRLSAFSLDIAIPLALTSRIRNLVRVCAMALLALVIVVGLIGPEVPTQNFATVFVWVIWWVGVFLFTALAVDLWSAGNPFRIVVNCTLRLSGLGQSERKLPAGVGWLAVVGLLFIAWLELVSDWSEDPKVLVVLVAVYVAGLFSGAALTGADTWFGAVDPLTRMFGLLGHIAPIAARRTGVQLRPPATGLVGLHVDAAGVVFIICLIAMVLFDGLSETPLWDGILEWITQSKALRPGLLELRNAGIDILKMIRSVGLLTTVVLAVLLYLGLTLAIWCSVRGTQPPSRIFTSFAASLLPIAVAYHLAHYVSYLALAGQLILPIVSDPLGLGWDIFGTANHRIDLGAINAEEVWWIAVAALVIGHGLSVLVAHAEALRVFPNRREAIRSQLPVMVFMVGLTSLSLWILAQPIVA